MVGSQVRQQQALIEDQARRLKLQEATLRRLDGALPPTASKATSTDAEGFAHRDAPVLMQKKTSSRLVAAATEAGAARRGQAEEGGGGGRTESCTTPRRSILPSFTSITTPRRRAARGSQPEAAPVPKTSPPAASGRSSS